MYGNPIDRTFVMESVSDVKAVIRNFNDCPITKRHILASNIKKAFNEFGMKQPVIVEENNMILNYLKQDYVICDEFFTFNPQKKAAKKAAREKEFFMNQVNATLMINETELDNYVKEYEKDINKMKSILKKEIPGCKFLEEKAKHSTRTKYGYQMHIYKIKLFELNDDNFKAFASKSKNKSIQKSDEIVDCVTALIKDTKDRIVTPFLPNGYRRDRNYGIGGYSKFKNGKAYITLDMSDEAAFKVTLYMEIVFKKTKNTNKVEETYKISEIDVDELKYKTYENINDVLSKLEPITESDLSYEQVVNSSSFPDTELTKKIKKLCVRNEGEEIITNLSDIDIFKIKAKLLKTSPGSVKVVNDNDTTFAVIENQTFTVGKINDKEYVLINDDMKYKKLYIDEVVNIKSIEELKKNMG